MQHPNELLETVIDIMIIDLTSYVGSILDINVLNSYVDPPAGLYMKFAVKPFLPGDQRYYYRSQFNISTDSRIWTPGAHITDFAAILTSSEDILDESGSVVLSFKDILLNHRYMTATPELPIIALEVAHTLVVNFLNTLCTHARVLGRNRLENLIREECHGLIYDDSIENSFSRLIDDVHTFVGYDTWNIYFTKLKGTTLIVEKYCDWRIYEYTRIMYDRQLEGT